VFLILERFTGIRDVAPDKFHITRRVVTLIVVMVGWVFFRAENISQAIGFLGVMFSVTDLPLTYELRLVLNYRNILFMMTALTVFFMPGEFFGINILIHKKDAIPLFAGVLMILMLLPYCVALIVGGSNSPFIYYRF
jgi:alginate O-acetyltransferase complex protein AlgI